MELAGIVKAEDAFWLFEEEFFAFDEELEDRIAIKDRFEVRDSDRVGLDRPGSGRIGFLSFLSELFRKFGDEKRGGEGGDFK